MQESNYSENNFIKKITLIVEENISNESFGVSELANEIGMSRSNLLRKVKTQTNLSVSQFIRQIRLKHSMELLKDTSLTVSEISYEVGFGSASYFIKCFHEHYGFPPGEAAGKELPNAKVPPFETENKKKRLAIISFVFVVSLFAFIIFVGKPFESKHKELEKSIAVLPFINDSNDSSNVHIINGLMESVLNNLQKIEDLRVISRTSVEKYRNTKKTIPEIAKELNVNYFIEGSGQKNGNELLLNIQLIQAVNDKHLWAEQYNREVEDIFKLQQEVAKKIANEIEVIITPEVEQQINKIPTENLLAYDYYLKGLDLFYLQGTENLIEAISYYEKAVAEDSEFALAYAQIAICYSFLDLFQAKKQYSYLININADKALLYDSKSPQSLVAKASYYLNIREFESALPHLEKALEYNPNSAMVINLLSNFYVNYSPNTEKYLQYALKGIALDIASHDSVTASYIYLHVGNAFIQAGFVKQAEKYINRSLVYNPENVYAHYVMPYIVYAKNRDLQETTNLLLEVFQKDTNRLDLMQELGKVYYQAGNNEEAFKYYKKFTSIREAQNLTLFTHENLKIASVFAKMGFNEESNKYLEAFKNYAENDISIYKHAQLAGYYSYIGDSEKALAQLKLFAEQENYHYWIVLFFEIDPVMEKLKNNPDFKKLFKQIEDKFWSKHDKIKSSLKNKGLIKL